jgi:hypothetical protein
MSVLLMTELQIRSLVRSALLEKRKKKKKKKSSSKSKSIKGLMLDKPFSTGGWPDGKDRGWLPDSKPVNKQIKDYLDDMGLL